MRNLYKHGMITSSNYTFKEYMAQLRQKKLKRTNCPLGKLRHQVSSSLLRTIYFALFDSHLCNEAQVWAQKQQCCEYGKENTK